MSADSLYSFPARLTSLPEVLGLLRSKAGPLGPDALLRAETALEELLTNTVMHGQTPHDPDARVWVGVAWADGACTLAYQDTSGAFDPHPKIAEAMERTLNPMDQRPPGGLGLLMVYRMADAFRYRHAGGRNCVELVFRARPSDAPPDPPA